MTALLPPVDLFVCVTCQSSGHAEPERPGALLHRALEALLRGRACPAPVRLHAVECLSVCKRPCTVAVSSAGKWTYVIGDLQSPAHDDALLDYLAAYAASPGGTPPLKERPVAIRAGTIARIPPRV